MRLLLDSITVTESYTESPVSSTNLTLKGQIQVHVNCEVSECYQSLTAHQHQKGHTMPKQVITIATSIQVFTVLSTALCESIRYQAKSEQEAHGP